MVNGYGVMVYANKDKYEGSWVKGEKDGSGKYYFVDGTIYEGFPDCEASGSLMKRVGRGR